MADIPNTEQITVKRDKKGQVRTFVGGHPATTYRGKVIEHLDLIKKYFTVLQEHHPEIIEFHAGAFATEGEYTKVGNPDAKFGPYVWFRVVSKELLSPWMFSMKDSSADTCAHNCVYYCLGQMCANWEYRHTVLNLIDKKRNNKQILHLITIDQVIQKVRI